MARRDRRISLRKLLLLASLVLFAVVWTGASTAFAGTGEGAPPALFSNAAVALKQAGAAFVRDKQVVRAHAVAVDTSRLAAAADVPAGSTAAAGSISLNLFDDVTFTADPVRFERTKDGFIWVGQLRGVEFSQVVIVANGGAVSGNITMPKARFHIRFVGGGVHEVQEIDPTKFPKDHPFDAPLIPRETIAEDAAADATLQGDSCGQIDVMVVYSATTRAAAGGTAAIQSLINLAIAETNQSYLNAGITQRVRLVHTEEVPFTETGNLEDALYCATYQEGCSFNIAAIREQYKADLVSFWVEQGGNACGIGWLMSTVSPSFAPYGYSAVARECATGYYSFGHELGHNMGARHDVFMDTGTTPYSYAHGYVHAASSAPWRTIMAYDNACEAMGFTCNRLQYWSNPAKSYGGAAMGNAQADNHATLNNTACTVANFKLAPGFTMSGTVRMTSTTGLVVAGATMSIAGKTTMTSSSGTFSITGIAAGTYTLTITKPGFLTYSKTVTVTGNVSNLVYIIAPALYNMSGTVRSGSTLGPVLAGAVVSIAGKTTTTSSTGTFTISAIPAGSYTLAISKSGFQSYSKVWVVNANQSGLVFALAPLCSMSGTVRSGTATGPVLSGAVVSIAGRSVTTSAYGTFSFTGIPAGTYSLTIAKTGFQTYTKAWTISANQSGLVFPLVPVYTLSGTVRSGSATGAVVAGAIVSIDGKSVTTSAYGTFNITGIPAGTYTLTVSKSGFVTYTGSYAIRANRSGLIIALRPLVTMSGTVRIGSATGPVLAGAEVSIAGKVAITSTSGTFSITGIPAANYSLTIWKPGFRTYGNISYPVLNNLTGLTFALSRF